MAYRYCHHLGLGGLWNQHVLDHFKTERASFIRSHLVLHRHLRHCCRLTHRQQPCNSGELDQELQPLCGGAGCLGAMVVWPQCGSLLFNHARAGFDVLFPAEGRGTSGIFLSTIYHPLLGVDIHLHLGRTPPFAVYRVAGLGAELRNGFQHYADLPFMGWDDQRSVDPSRGLGPSPRFGRP